jgi:hypothetical protein
MTACAFCSPSAPPSTFPSTWSKQNSDRRLQTIKPFYSYYGLRSTSGILNMLRLVHRLKLTLICASSISGTYLVLVGAAAPVHWGIFGRLDVSRKDFAGSQAGFLSDHVPLRPAA